MRYVSHRRAARQRQRREIASRYHGPERCSWPFGCPSEAVDLHETIRRSQRRGAETDVDVMIPLCRHHHDWVTTHPAEAHGLGLVAWSWEDRPPDDDTRVACDHVATQPASVPDVAGPAKVKAAFYVNPGAADLVTKLAGEYTIDPATVYRTLLSVGAAHLGEVRTRLAHVAAVDNIATTSPEPAPAARPGRPVPKPSARGRRSTDGGNET